MNTRKKSASIETFTLTLVGKDGLQFPIGEKGAARFHLFHDWTKAHAAIADVVATVGIDHVHAIACTKTQTHAGRMVDFSASHYSQDEVRELCQQYAVWHTPRLWAARGDGRRVRVTVPN